LLSDLFGLYLNGLGDVNKDGFDDFAIGSLISFEVFLVYGRATFPSVIDFSITSNFGGVLIQGATIVDLFPTSIEPAGDMNRDGFDDFFIGTTGFTFNSSFALIYGGASLPSTLNVSTYTELVTIDTQSSPIPFAGSCRQALISGNYDVNQDGE